MRQYWAYVNYHCSSDGLQDLQYGHYHTIKSHSNYTAPSNTDCWSWHYHQISKHSTMYYKQKMYSLWCLIRCWQSSILILFKQHQTYWWENNFKQNLHKRGDELVHRWVRYACQLCSENPRTRVRFGKEKPRYVWFKDYVCYFEYEWTLYLLKSHLNVGQVDLQTRSIIWDCHNALKYGQTPIKLFYCGL